MPSVSTVRVDVDVMCRLLMSCSSLLRVDKREMPSVSTVCVDVDVMCRLLMFYSSLLCVDKTKSPTDSSVLSSAQSKPSKAPAGLLSLVVGSLCSVHTS